MNQRMFYIASGIVLPYLRYIRVSIGFNDTEFFQFNSPSTWMYHGTSGTQSFLFIATVWWISRATDYCCIANDPIDLFKLKREIYNHAANLQSCFTKCQAPDREPRYVTWNPTRENLAILNVDGSSMGNPGPSGF